MTLSEKRYDQTVMCMVYLHQKRVSSRLPKQGVPKWKNPPPIYSLIFKEIDVASVHSDSHSLNGDSSNDVLQLDAKLFRMSADVICRTLTHLYNISLSSKTIPGECKLVRMTPIYKGSGDVQTWTKVLGLFLQSPKRMCNLIWNSLIIHYDIQQSPKYSYFEYDWFTP